MLPDERQKKMRAWDWESQQRILGAARQARAEVLGRFLSRVWRGISAYLPRLRASAERRQIDALAGLDDRLLADIGLDRADVQALRLGRIRLDDLGARRGRHEPPSAQILDLPPRKTEPETRPHRHAA